MGASPPFGKCIAIDYSQNGYHVHLFGRNESAINGILLNIQSSGGAGSVICADIRNSQELANAIQKILAKTPTLDVAINCAGVVRTDAVDEMLDDDFELMRQTNLTHANSNLRVADLQCKSSHYQFWTARHSSI